ncbi:hypothetical protein BsWGS_26676 [Bradybaena similaris]
MFRTLALMLIPLVALVSLACYWMITNVIEKSSLENVKLQVNKGQTVGGVVYALQLERAGVVFAIEEKNMSMLGEQYTMTDFAIRDAASYPTACFQDTETFIQSLKVHRNQISTNVTKRNTHDEVSYYSQFTVCLLDVLMNLAKDMTHGSVWQDTVSYKMMLKAQESVGIMLSVGIPFFEIGSLPLDYYNMLKDEDSAAKEYIDIATIFSPHAKELYSRLNLTNSQTFQDMETFRQHWKQNYYNDSGPVKAKEFHQGVMKYFKILSDMNKEISKLVIEKLNTEIKLSVNMMIIACLVFVFVLIMTPILVKLMHTLTSSIQNYAIEASLKSQQLIIEKQRSDSLLYQMLPKSVAQQLKMNKSVNAEYYEQVTLFFSDIVGFTNISAASTPLQVVVFLNELYRFFDDTLDHYDVYKVETIGDAYMVVSGLPTRNGSAHVAEISLMALELLKTAKDFTIPHMPQRSIELRIGCHSGSAVAGVVGNKMPRYCLFGDTVNTASRMESHGLPNRIHISVSTNNLLMKLRGFTTERRGLVEVKGKGQMETFWLLNTERPLRSLTQANAKNLPDVTKSTILNAVALDASRPASNASHLQMAWCDDKIRT